MSMFPTQLAANTMAGLRPQTGSSLSPLTAGLGVLQAGLSIAGSLNRNSQIGQQIQANKQATATTLAQLEGSAKANIADRKREADSIIGTIRAAAGGSGAAAPLAVLRNVDFSRARGDDRIRQNLANQSLAIRTQQAIQNWQLKQSKQSPLEAILGGFSAGGSTALQINQLGAIL